MLDALVGHLPEILELMTTNGGENSGSESKVGNPMISNLLSKFKWSW